MSAKLPTGSDYSLELDLAHEIMPEYCTHKICPSKIEIKLKKRDGLRWTVLEGSPVVQEDIQAIPQGDYNNEKLVQQASSFSPMFITTVYKHMYLYITFFFK